MGPPQVDKSVTGSPISIGGRKFVWGAGTHAIGTFYVDLHGTADRFSGSIVGAEKPQPAMAIEGDATNRVLVGVSYFAGWWKPLPNKWNYDPAIGDWRPQFLERVPLLGKYNEQPTMDKEMDSKSITIALDDDRQVDFKRNDKTKFFKSGEEVKNPKFAPGDQLSVEGPEDEKGFLIAVNVYWEKAGGAETTAEKGKDSSAVDTWKDNSKDSAAANAPPVAPATHV